MMTKQLRLQAPKGIPEDDDKKSHCVNLRTAVLKALQSRDRHK